MGKHKTMGEIEFTASRGTTFKKKPSETNYCVAKELKDKTHANRGDARQAFVEALNTCGVNLKPETRKKFGLKAPVKKAPAKK